MLDGTFFQARGPLYLKDCLVQGCTNFLAHGPHLDVEFVRGPHYSDPYKKFLL